MQPRGDIWRHARARLDLSVEDAAAALRIRPGSLRNIEGEQPRAVVSERLAYRAERLYHVAFDELVVDDRKNDPNPNPRTPTHPPRQPKGPSGPPRRDDHEGERKSPPRDEHEAVA